GNEDVGDRGGYFFHAGFDTQKPDVKLCNADHYAEVIRRLLKIGKYGDQEFVPRVEGDKPKGDTRHELAISTAQQMYKKAISSLVAISANFNTLAHTKIPTEIPDEIVINDIKMNAQSLFNWVGDWVVKLGLLHSDSKGINLNDTELSGNLVLIYQNV